MKLIFRCFITLGLIISFSCNKDSTDSDCKNSNHELSCWTIIDDATENSIAGVYGVIVYGTGLLDLVSFGSTNDGLACFCFPLGGVIQSGFVRADGYEEMDLSGLIFSEISILRLIPLD